MSTSLVGAAGGGGGDAALSLLDHADVVVLEVSEQLVELVEHPRVDRLVDPGAGRHAVVADAPQVGEHLAAHPLVDAPQAPLDAEEVLLVVPAKSWNIFRVLKSLIGCTK